MLASDFVDYVTTVGKVAGVLVGVIASLGVVAKSPLGRAVRWVYVQLVGEPVGKWFRTQVSTAASEVVDEKLLKRNGGTTIPDLSARMELLASKVDRNHRETVANHRANTARLDGIEHQLGDAATAAAAVAENLAKHEGDEP